MHKIQHDKADGFFIVSKFWHDATPCETLATFEARADTNGGTLCYSATSEELHKLAQRHHITVRQTSYLSAAQAKAEILQDRARERQARLAARM